MSTKKVSYSQKSVSELKKECKERDIDLPPGYVKKQELIRLLKEDETETKAAKKLMPTPFEKKKKRYGGEIDISDDSEEDVDTSTLYVLLPRGVSNKKRTLAVGKPVEGEFRNAYITGAKDKSTLDWADLTIRKKIPRNTFDTIAIVEPSLFITDGGVDPRRVSSIFSTLSKKGEVWVASKPHPNECNQLLNHLISNNYIYMGTIDTIERTYVRYMLGGGGIPRLVEEDESEEEVFLTPSEDPEGREYKKVKIGRTFTTAKKETEDVNLALNLRLSITMAEFEHELQEGTLADRIYSSAHALMEYKGTFYRRCTRATQQESDRIQAKIKKLKLVGVSDRVIQDMYPMADFYLGFIVQLQEIQELIKKKKEEMTPDTLKTGLLDAMYNPTKGFASIIGREDVKSDVISQIYAFSKTHKVFTNSFANICLTGKAGTGKTALAKVIGYIFSKSGILVTDKVKIVSRADLVGQYIGHTAPRTRAMLFETLEGVLFIDEAYQLAGEGKDFGLEAITEIVNFIDKYIGMSIVMVAGYEDKMNGMFFPANEGLARRFPYRLKLSDYTNKQLADILVRFIEEKSDVKIDEKSGNYIYSIVVELQREYPNKAFLNQAGDMLNLGTSIVKTIYSSYNVEWIEGKVKNNKRLILEGVKDYLDVKGIYVE